LHLDDWARRHRINIGLAEVSQRVAVVAGPLLRLLNQIQMPAVLSTLPARPASARWGQFYREPFDFYRVIGNKISRSNLGTRTLSDYDEVARTTADGKTHHRRSSPPTS
jgi:hypothetical protein